MKSLNKWAVIFGIIFSIMAIGSMALQATGRFATKDQLTSMMKNVDTRLTNIEHLLERIIFNGNK